MVTRRKIRDHDPEVLAQLHEPPPVPCTAIFSRTDRVAHWRACREGEAPDTDNIEIRGSHCGLGFNSVVFYAIADRNATDTGSPFERDGWRRLFYKLAAPIRRPADG